jgi:hypothetical protein
MLTNELELYIRARFTLIVLTTVEEERALELMRQLCERMRRPCISWDVADGFQAVANVQGALPSARDPLTALEQIDKWDGSALFVLKDFHEAWANPAGQTQVAQCRPAAQIHAQEHRRHHADGADSA